MNKPILLTILVSALLLGGCATSTDTTAYAERMYDKQLAAHKEFTPTPACQIVGDGVNPITMSGIKSFTCYGDTKQAQLPTYTPIKSTGEVVFDKVLPVLEVLANPLVSLAIHKDNNATQRHMSDNSVATHDITMGTIGAIASQGIIQVGTTASEGINVGRYPPAATVIVPAATPVIVPSPAPVTP